MVSRAEAAICFAILKTLTTSHEHCTRGWKGTVPGYYPYNGTFQDAPAHYGIRIGLPQIDRLTQ